MSGRSPSQRVAATLAGGLHRAGTELLFGLPGGGANLDVIGAAEAAGLRFVLAHSEGSAALMAAVAAELTGRPGACVVTRGPGAASAVNGVAHTMLDRQPMVLITDCVTAAERARVSHQRLDHAAMFATLTKASLVLGPLTSAADVHAALALTLAGRPGPVHLDFDPTATNPAPAASTGTSSTAARGDPTALRQALLAARRPVVVAGLGAVGAAAGLRRFVHDTSVPVLTTYKAKGVIADDLPNAAGLITGATIEAPLLGEADLIIGVGLDPVELIPAGWPYPAPVVLIGCWPTDDSTYFGDRVSTELVAGDAGELADLLTDLGRDLRSSWLASDAENARRSALDRLLAAVPPEPQGVLPQEVVTTARALAPPGTIATVDAGAHMLLVVPLWDVAQPGELLVSSGLATMGFALPAAVAAALTRPGTRIICFTGDGGLGMVLAELETLARLRLDVVVVVFDDRTLSLIAIKQGEGQGGDGATRYSVTDFAAVAEGLGVPAFRADSEPEYRRAMTEALRRPGPSLIDVAVEPRGYPSVLEAIRGTAGATG